MDFEGAVAGGEAFSAGDFLTTDFLATDFLATDFLATDFLAADFAGLASDLFADFLATDVTAEAFLASELFPEGTGAAGADGEGTGFADAAFAIFVGFVGRVSDVAGASAETSARDAWGIAVAFDLSGRRDFDGRAPTGGATSEAGEAVSKTAESPSPWGASTAPPFFDKRFEFVSAPVSLRPPRVPRPGFPRTDSSMISESNETTSMDDGSPVWPVAEDAANVP